MRRHIVERLRQIVPARYDLTTTHHHRPNRHFATFCSTLCLPKGYAHEMFVL